MLQDLVKRFESFPSKSKLLIFGGGFSGQHVAKLARQLGAHVLCSRRNCASPNADFEFDSVKNTIPPSNILENVTHLLSCIPPNENGEDPVLRTLSSQLEQMSLKWVG